MGCSSEHPLQVLLVGIKERDPIPDQAAFQESQ